MKKLLIGILILITIAAMSLSSYAHSGRTDGNGGHYDRSTGEYHYHHGYSAHDHYDMDGDGDLDCPIEYRHSQRTVEESTESYEDLYIPSLPSVDFESDFTYPSMPNVSLPSTPAEPGNTQDGSGLGIALGIILVCLALAGLVFAFAKRK